MKKHKIKSSLEPWDIENEKVDNGLTAYAGLPVVIEAWYALGMDKACQKHLRLRTRQSKLTDAQWAEVLTTLLLAGGRTVEDLEPLKSDAGLVRLWPLLKKASPRSALNFLHRFHNSEMTKSRQGKAHIHKEEKNLRGLGEVNRHLLEQLQEKAWEPEATIDVDASIHESSKREALWTYEGVKGYQPVIAYWAEQGVIVADQFRDGNVPAGMGNKEFIRRALDALPRGVEKRRVRGDSALYEQKVLRMLEREGVEFVISADVTEQLRGRIRNVSDKEWKKYWKITRRGDRIATDKEWTEVDFVPEEPGAKKGEKPFRYIAIRIPKKEPDLFEGRYRHFAVVTNRWRMEGNELLNWGRQRCGTVEWAHDLLKNDFAARTFPSGKFGANAAWYRFNVLAFNLKVALTKIGLRDYIGVRPHTLRMNLFHIAARIISHSRKLSMIFAQDNAPRKDNLNVCRSDLAMAFC